MDKRSRLPSTRSAITSSIKKHGTGEFILVILELCDAIKCVEREQQHIDHLVRFGVDYNLNPKAGS